MPDVDILQHQTGLGIFPFKDFNDLSEDPQIFLDTDIVHNFSEDVLLSESPEPPFLELFSKMDPLRYSDNSRHGSVDDFGFSEGQPCYSSPQQQYQTYRTMHHPYTSPYTPSVTASEPFAYPATSHLATPSLTEGNTSASPSIFGGDLDSTPAPYTAATTMGDFTFPAMSYPMPPPDYHNLPPINSHHGYPISTSSAVEPQTSTALSPDSPKERLSCPKCPATFNRPADLQRHNDSTHRKNERIAKGELIDCPWPKCPRKGSKGFGRHDHLLEHRRGYHREAIPKRGGRQARRGTTGGISKPTTHQTRGRTTSALQ